MVLIYVSNKNGFRKTPSENTFFFTWIHHQTHVPNKSNTFTKKSTTSLDKEKLIYSYLFKIPRLVVTLYESIIWRPVPRRYASPSSSEMLNKNFGRDVILGRCANRSLNESFLDMLLEA